MLRFTRGLLPAGGSHAQRAGGRPLPPYTRRRMEQLFGVSFEDVRIHVDGVPGQVGAIAFTSGSDIYFAPGHFDPATPHGLQLIAHELTHVVQQRSGRVRSPAGSGAAVVDDPALEEEARQMGTRALSGAAPPFLPSAHEYHRGVSAVQRGRDMRVIQRMPRRKSFAETIGEYIDADGFHYLELQTEAQLFHTSSSNLSGAHLNPPAFLTAPWGCEYGKNQKAVKRYVFEVEREARLVLLNHAGNLTELLRQMEPAPEAHDALQAKTKAILENGRVVAFHNRTEGKLDKVVAEWFQQQGFDGWYNDPALGCGMDFEEVMISQPDVLSAGKLLKL